jgi:anti-sigma28 factor (negative regulator of flagellin synthesis)
MEIPRDLRPADSSLRRRATDAVSRVADQATSAAADTSAGKDAAHFGDAAAISRFVDVLKTMNPASLHRVEDLRTRIANGSYSADPEELANLIVGDERPPAPTSGPRSR